MVTENEITDAERAMLHSADAKTAWAECEALRARVAELEAALSTDAEPVAPKPHLEGGDTVEFTLRAMAQNYAVGHSWDHLDGEACLLAADELQMLRAGIKRMSDEEEYCAEVTGDDPFSMVYLSARLAKTEAERDALLRSQAEPVGQVDASYGNEGMLVACYKPNSLPVGTKLYAAPPAPSVAVKALLEAANDVISSASDTYKKRNGHIASFQDDSGEKCWIVPFDAFEGLRSALSAQVQDAP